MRPTKTKRTVSDKRAARAAAQPTRDRLLDAAEALFASRGFYGVSIRDITERARVQLALVSYHFGSKQKLFKAVIRRRGVVHAAGMQRHLDEMLARRNGKASVDDIIETFCIAVFERMLSDDPGWPYYIQLLARSANTSQEERFVAAMNELFDPVLTSYVNAIARALPGVTRANLFSAFYFFQGALIYMTTNTGGIDRLSAGALHSVDFQQLLPRVVRFFSAGFRELAQVTRPPARTRRRAVHIDSHG